MRQYSILFFCLFLGLSFKGKAQDTLFLHGQGRCYEDSIVLRWNALGASQYLHIYKNSLIIERMGPGDTAFSFYAKQTALAPERWNGQGDDLSNQATAAASLQNLLISSRTAVTGTQAQIEKAEKERFYWATMSFAADLSPPSATQLNLRFVDTRVKKNQAYFYKIYVAGSDFVSDTLFIFLSGEAYTPAAVMPPLGIEKENQIDLQWQADSFYTAYFIEKNEDGRAEHKVINKRPLAVGKSHTQFYQDSVRNYRPYGYRLRAIDAFGDYSLPSETLVLMGRDRTPPPMLQAFRVEERAEGGLLIRWKSPGTQDGELGIALGINFDGEDRYEPLTDEVLSPFSDSFYWSNPEKQSSIYLLAQVADTAGNTSSKTLYYLFEDNTPPAIPTGLVGKSDSLGVVTLTWDMGTEKDLDGYLVYFSNDSTTTFSGIYNQALPGNIFYDTLSLKMLNKEVYYRIQAVDKHFNRSANSAILKVLRPDYLAPVSPEFRNYSVSDSGIFMHWYPSSSADVVKQYLYRIGPNGDTVIHHMQLKDSCFMDSVLVRSSKYQYYLKAEDESKNFSAASNSLYLVSASLHFHTEVKIISIEYDSASNAAMITWEYPTEGIRKIQLYRGNERAKLSPMPAKIAVDAHQYLDTRIERNAAYFYAIRIYFTDGTETRLSIPIGILSE